jgi:hypothetical protein
MGRDDDDVDGTASIRRRLLLWFCGVDVVVVTTNDCDKSGRRTRMLMPTKIRRRGMIVLGLG